MRSANPATLWASEDGIHRQGSLDGLCGIYSAINSISLLLGEAVDCRDLFGRVVRKLGRKLPNIIMNGMNPTELEHIVLASCVDYLAEQNVQLSYRLATAGTLADYWRVMQDHYQEHGEGSILLSMTGIYEHWTCVRKITERCIMLADSSKLHRLYRSKVTIGSTNKQRIHTLVPNETFLLSIQPISSGS